MSWYLKVLKNYVGFQGRARRKEYWMFFLFHTIISIILYLPVFITSPTFNDGGISDEFILFTILYFLYLLAVFLPVLAVTVRRLHDSGKSGWWYLIALVPYAGGIVLLVFMCLDSDVGHNNYGPNPKMDASYASYGSY